MAGKSFRVLGCDPGRVNFGWAIYGDSGLEAHGTIEGAEDITRLDAAGAFFEQLILKQTPTVCCIERFHQRPGPGAIRNMEVVNLMIGQCRAICRLHGVPVKLITASEHKAWTAKHFEVQKRATKQRKGSVSKKFDLSTYVEWQVIRSEHEVDAANIAKYAHDHKMSSYREVAASKRKGAR
jgi:Holliday junction resolvasome RuvABC endonuclease subunit